MVYFYYKSDENSFLLWEMRTNPPYEACITSMESRVHKYTFWSNRPPIRSENLDISSTPNPDTNPNWSDKYPSISLLLTFNTLEDYFTWADQDHPELLI